MTYPEFIDYWRDGSKYVECHTSGSTGKPKSIRLPKVEMAKSAHRTIRFFGLDNKAKLHSCISADYIGGKMMAVRSELLGAKLSWEKPSNAPLQAGYPDEIDLLAVVPSQMISVLDRLERGDRLPVLKHIIIGGAPITPDLHRRILESGLDAWETYGMTETCSHIALRRVGNPGAPFVAFDCIKLSLTSDGRLKIEMEGWNSIETNDIAILLDSGKFLIEGRADNVINSGGKKVHPEQVELRLEELLHVPVLIFGEPDPKWGERVVMQIEDDDRFENEYVTAICKEHLSAECVPKKIVHGEIPRTENGKKLRNSKT